MRIKKIYFNRMYDQWRGEPLYVEDGLDDDKLYIRIMDVENYKRGAVNTITVDYKDLNGATYTILGECDYDKRLAIFDIPLSILSNNGVYEVGFSLSFNTKDKEGVMLKTAIQTFEIIDAIEADDEAISQDPHYPILVDLINQLADYKVDTSIFPTREEMVEAIDESINLDKIIEQINNKGYITQTQLNNILKNYLTKFESSDFARRSDLNKFVTNIKFIQELDRYVLKSSMNNYVLKEEGKTLTTHDLTDELYEKLVNLDLGEDGVEIDLSEYQKKIDNILNTKDKTITGAINEIKNDIPTKTSQLQNDSGYLTQHQDLSDYAKKTELHSHENKDVLDNITTEKVSSWDNKSEFDGDYDSLTNKPTIPTKVSELENDNLFVTEKFVNDKIIEASLGKEVDLSEYAKKTDIPYVPTKVSELENDKGYASEQFVDKNIPIEIENLSGTDNTKTILDYLKEIVGFFISDTIILGNKIKYKHIIRGKINTNISINEKDYSNISYISMINVDYNILTTFILADEGNLRIETPYTPILDDTDMYIGLSINQIGEVHELIGSGSVSGGSSHEHDNKDILDTITQEMINTWNNKSDLTINDNINEVSKTQTYSNEMIESRLLETNTEITAVQDDLDSMDERVTYLEAEQTKMGEFDGSYNSLTNKPVIPSKTSELTNDSEFTTKEYVDENDYYTYPTILYDDNSLPLGYVDITTLELTKVYKIPKETLDSALKKIPLKAPNDDGTWFIVDDGSNNIGWGGYNDTTITVFAKSNTNIMIYMNSINGYNKFLSIKKTDGVWGLNQSKANILTTGNTQEYTPTKDYNPATKKYVDDKVAGVNASTITGLSTVATSGDYNDLTNKPTIPIKTSELTNDSGFITSIPAEYVTDTYLNNKLSSMPKSLARHDGAQVLSYIDKHNILERENMVDKAFQVFTSLFYSTSIPTSGDISNLNVNVIDFVNTIMNACTEFGEDIFLYFDFIFDSPIKFVVMPSSSSNMFLMIIDNGKTSVGLQIEFTGDGTGQYTRTSTKLVSSNEIATVATSGNYNDLTNKPTIPTVTNDLTNALKSNYDTAYTHSQSAHAPVNAQKNNDITKAEIEAKLIGNITTHTHSQYLTEHQDLSDYALATDLHEHDNKTILDNITQTTIDMINNAIPYKGVVQASGNLNNCTATGFYKIQQGASNLPINEYSFLMVYNEAGQSTLIQVWFSATSDKQRIRRRANLTWGNWYTVYTENEPPTIPSEYITETELNDKGYATEDFVTETVNNASISGGYTHPETHPASMITGLSTVATSGNYNDLTNKPTIPTVTNNLTDELKTNYDTAYEHSQSAHAPSNAQKNSDITKSEIEAKLIGDITTHTHSQYLTEHQDISNLALKSELHSHTNKTILDNITSDKINSWDNKSNFSGSYNDLTNKPTIPTKTSQLTNDSGFITSVPSEYITETELDAKGYLTEHQDISGKVDKIDGKGLSTNDLTDDLKANYDSAYEHSQSTHAPTNAQKNSDITKSEIEAKLIGNITTHTHSQYLTEHQSLEGYALKTDLHSHTNKIILDNITQEKIDSWDNKSEFSGSYNDLTDKPTIPSAYTHPSTHPASMITGLSTVATSGNYNDLSNKPTIPTIPDSLPANGGNAETVDNFHIWQGTQAEYDAISSKDANTIYLIKEG